MAAVNVQPSRSGKSPYRTCGMAMLALLVLGTGVQVAHAESLHTVKAGQSLSKIAQRYRVSVGALLSANQMTRQDGLREGQVVVVPDPGEVFVGRGDTLSGIARRSDVSVSELAKLNRIAPDTPLQLGQRLLLPGHKPAAKAAQARNRWGTPKQRGVATLYRVWSQEKKRVRLVDRRGRLSKGAPRAIQHLLRARANGKRRAPHPRLVRLLARVSDHFGGRAIHIISGYRSPGGFTRKTSRHVRGHAIDFRVEGVPLQVLRDYCAQFSHVGVGLYPNSHFVHLDVRRDDRRWTDWSGPGEAPRKTRPEDSVPDEPLEATEADDEDGLPPIDDEAETETEASATD